jgi:exodeoxyribonuclease V gamma subunit
MFLYTSNRLEYLSDIFIKTIEEPLPHPLEKEIVIVQSRGMSKWLSLNIAEKTGICANFSFLFPKAFANEIFKKVLSADVFVENTAFNPNILCFKIMQIIVRLIDEPEFESVKKYINNDYQEKLYAFSEKIAQVFDNYIIYRSFLISLWEKDDNDKNWQAVLWRTVIKDLGIYHFVHAKSKFLESLKNLKSASFNTESLPKRISVFGISSLPPVYLEIIYALSFFMDINIFLMNPCRHYWGDILSKRDITKIQKKYLKKESINDDYHIDKGNSLLSSMGSTGKEFFNLVMEMTNYEINEEEFFHDPENKTLLSCIQSDILNLTESGAADVPKKIINKNDDSIIINSCHTPLREVEVLYDRLLDMFEKDNLSPDDILVMVPDIEEYAPYIHAVFDFSLSEKVFIPFSVADRDIRAKSVLIDTFFSIINLDRERLAPSCILSILEFDAVKEKFGIKKSDIILIRDWIKGANIRWGIDDFHKKMLGVPRFKENTWEAGFEKLILGYAMQDTQLFKGVAPYENIDIGNAEVLGKFIDFTKKLFYFYNKIRKKHLLSKWALILNDILKTFFADNEKNFEELAPVCDAFLLLDKIEKEHSYSEKVNLEIVKKFLNKNIETGGFDSGFLKGGITFCAALPMRSIPFKIICFMGLTSDSFPRQDVEISFDLMSKKHMQGDRAKREDDKFLFLEALLSAREKFYISYIGKSVKENQSYPPSAVVSELLDYIEQGFEYYDKKIDIKEHILIEHKLQPFSPSYFDENEKLFTYNKAHLVAAKSLYEKKNVKNLFYEKKLPALELNKIDIKSLEKFFSNPVKYFLNTRLSVFLETEEEFLETENFDLKALEKYKLENIILEKFLKNKKKDNLYAVSVSSGILPHGEFGKSIYDDIYRKIEKFITKTQDYIVGTQKNFNIDFSIKNMQITGILKNCYKKEGIVKLKYAKIKPIDIIKLWIEHIILNIFKPDIPLKSRLIGIDPKNAENFEMLSFSKSLSKEEAFFILSDIIKIFFLGAQKPLHFYGFSSYDYAQCVIKKKMEHQKALKKARYSYLRSDSKNPYYDFCFREENPLNDEFAELSLKVFEPILQYIERDNLLI